MKFKLLFLVGMFSFLFFVCNIGIADQIEVKTLNLDEVVKISEYILKVEKISGNRYKVTDLLFGIIDKDCPNKGKEINITDYSKNKKSKDTFSRISWTAPKYIPDYMKLISKQIQKIQQNAEDIEGKILDIDLIHSEIFQSIDTKTLSDGRAINLMGEISKKNTLIRQEAINSQKYLGNLKSKIQELRKNSDLKIVFLKRTNKKDYCLIVIDGFELIALEDKVKKAISKRVNSNNSNLEQGKTYKYQNVTTQVPR